MLLDTVLLDVAFCFRIIAELCSFEKKRKIWLKMHLIGKLAKISSNQK